MRKNGVKDLGTTRTAESSILEGVFRLGGGRGTLETVIWESAMENLSPWRLSRQGHTDEGLRQIRVAYAEKQSLPNVLQLGLAYLWLEDFRAAWEHFDSLNRQKPKFAAVFYQLAGTAKWCLDQHGDAVAQWRLGCKCGYTDAAGGVESPLLLFAASVIDPASCPHHEPAELLDKRSKGWYRN